MTLPPTRIIGLLVLLASVAACSTTTKAQSAYWGEKPIRVEVAATATFVPTHLDVYLHPDDPGKAAVWPPFSESMKIAVSDGTDPWIATLPDQRAAYEHALLSALSRAGRECLVDSATPHPDLLMFEFTYHCNRSTP